MILMSNRRPKKIYGTEKITAIKQTPGGAYKDVRTTKNRDQESARDLSWVRRNLSWNETTADAKKHCPDSVYS